MNNPAAESSMPNFSPPPVPDFDLIRVIGEGGFGRVWLARNQTTGRLRAIKLIPLRGGDAAGREISSLTRLEANIGRQHPHLLTIHHVGKTTDHFFYVMDLADAAGGEDSNEENYRPLTLQNRLESGSLSAAECASFARQLLAGLAFLHKSAMVHRDVKPANCLFVAGELKLADFGLLTDDGPQVSRVGTRTYMPPDGRMDARADVYAAGLVIYEMASGLPADCFPRPGQRAEQFLTDPLLAALMRTVLRACEPEPQNRFANASQMLDEFETLASTAKVRRSAKSRFIAAAVGGLVVVAALTISVLWLNRPRLVHVNFVTRPFEATVWLDDELQVDENGKPYKTPCTIENLPARPHRVVFRREGATDVVIDSADFAKNRRIAGEL